MMMIMSVCLEYMFRMSSIHLSIHTYPSVDRELFHLRGCSNCRWSSCIATNLQNSQIITNSHKMTFKFSCRSSLPCCNGKLASRQKSVMNSGIITKYKGLLCKFLGHLCYYLMKSAKYGNRADGANAVITLISCQGQQENSKTSRLLHNNCSVQTMYKIS